MKYYGIENTRIEEDELGEEIVIYTEGRYEYPANKDSVDNEIETLWDFLKENSSEDDTYEYRDMRDFAYGNSDWVVDTIKSYSL